MQTDLKILEDLLIEIRDKTDTILKDIRITPNQVVIAEGLSEISENLGVISSGEFRAGNGIEPGYGFTGTRMAYPAMEYEDELYNLVGVNNDVAQVGFNSEDGTFMAGAGEVILGADGASFAGGNAVINRDGISGTDLLTWLVKQTATNDTYIRTGKLGLALPEGEDIPAWELGFESPAGANGIVNGGAELGNFTGWTKTTETNGTWTIISTGYSRHSGTYAFMFSHPAGSTASTGVLTSDRVLVTAGNNYLCSGYRGFAEIGVDSPIIPTTCKIEVKWYDDPSAGSLIRTNLIIGSVVNGEWLGNDVNLRAPTYAESAAVVITVVGGTLTQGMAAYFDDISCAETAINQKLQITDDSLLFNGDIIAPKYATATVSVGLTQNALSNASPLQSYMEQTTILYRPIKLNSILWDIYTVSGPEYTITIRDNEGNTLHTLSPVIPFSSGENSFAAGNIILMPGMYRIRLTSSTPVRWYYRATGDTYYSQYGSISPLYHDGTVVANVRAAFRLVFYDSIN